MSATQTGSQSGESNAMELCSVDFSLETMQKCKHFDGEIYQTYKELLPDSRDFHEDTDLFNAAELLKKGETSFVQVSELENQFFLFFQLLLLLLFFINFPYNPSLGDGGGFSLLPPAHPYEKPDTQGNFFIISNRIYFQDCAQVKSTLFTEKEKNCNLSIRPSLGGWGGGNRRVLFTPFAPPAAPPSPLQKA